jgi:hypothetical protein
MRRKTTMADKWIDRVQQGGSSTMLTPSMLALVQGQAQEFKERAEKAEAENKQLKFAILLLSAVFAEKAREGAYRALPANPD